VMSLRLACCLTQWVLPDAGGPVMTCSVTRPELFVRRRCPSRYGNSYMQRA
jgi:hypothetical protein